MTTMKRMLAMGLATAMMMTAMTACSSSSSTTDSSDTTAESGQELVVKIATTVSGETSPTLQALRLLETNVEERTEGRIDIQIFAGSQLGAEVDVISQVRDGDVEMTTINPMSNGSSTITTLAAMEQYFLFESDEHALAFMNGEGGQMMNDAWNQWNLQGLAFFPLGFRNLTSSKAPVESMEDMAGLKIRGYNEVQIAAWESVGCNLSMVDWSETFTAMQQKLIDGQEGALTSFSESKFYEVQEYFTFTRHVYGTDMLVANQSWWEGLSEEDATILSEEIAIAEAFQQQELLDQNAALVEELSTTYGTQFNELDQDVLDEMAEKMGAITEAAIVELCGQEVFDQVMAYADEALASIQ